MWEQLKSILPAIELSFTADAAQFNERFKQKRSTKDGKGLHSGFCSEVKSVYDSYYRKYKTDIQHCPANMPSKTHSIIASRVNQLNDYLTQTQKTGDDHHLLLFVLSMVFVDDENSVSRLIDPLNYQDDLLAPLKEVLRAQAREGFNVALPQSSETQQTFITELQKEIAELSLENSELRAQLEEALEVKGDTHDALQVRIDASERLIAELELQAKETATKAEVTQARSEVREMFKKRVGKGGTPTAKSQTQKSPSVDDELIFELCGDMAPPPMVAPLLKTDIFKQPNKPKHTAAKKPAVSPILQ